VAVLVDTNAIYALADAGEPDHAAVRDYVASTDEVLLVPVTVLPEVDYLTGQRLGSQAELATLRAISQGELALQLFTDEDLDRSVQLIEQYAGSDIGLVDASIVAIAERLRITRILTLDRRHFGTIRPRHCAAFELVP
jgi:predicted nucleic acid-binding protein